MTDKHIPVSAEEFNRALRVWLRVAPNRIWREYAAYEKLKAEHRNDPEKEPDVKGELADYITGKLKQAGWMIERREPAPLGSPPAWKGKRHGND